MQLCNPWTSGDGAEVSIAIGVREGRLPQGTGGRAMHAYLPAPSPSSALGKKGPQLGPFCVI